MLMRALREVRIPKGLWQSCVLDTLRTEEKDWQNLKETDLLGSVGLFQDFRKEALVCLKQDFTVTLVGIWVGLQAGGWHPSGERSGSAGLGAGLRFMGGNGWVRRGG